MSVALHDRVFPYYAPISSIKHSKSVATQDRVFPHYVPNSYIKHGKVTLKIVPKRFCEV
jgi:hypothetical protein